MWKNYIHVNFLFVIEYGNNGGDVRYTYVITVEICPTKFFKP